MVSVLQERFQRECASTLTPQRIYEHTLILTSDEKEAEVNRAWRQLDLMDK